MPALLIVIGRRTEGQSEFASRTFEFTNLGGLGERPGRRNESHEHFNGSQAMVLVLCIGDLHIPQRATDLPAKFRALLVPGKIQHILCPGNLCTKVLRFARILGSLSLFVFALSRKSLSDSQDLQNYLKTVCANLHVTQGDFDENRHAEEEVLRLPEQKRLAELLPKRY